MKDYSKFMFVANIVMTIIFMIPISILCINIIRLNFDFREIKYSLVGSIFGIIYIIVSWYFYKLQKNSFIFILQQSKLFFSDKHEFVTNFLEVRFNE